MGRTCYSYGGTESYKTSPRCSGRRKKTGVGRNWDGRMVWWRMAGSWGRETGGVLQGVGTAGRSFWRRPWPKRGCCASDDDDDDDVSLTCRLGTILKHYTFPVTGQCDTAHSSLAFCGFVFSHFASFWGHPKNKIYRLDPSVDESIIIIQQLR